MGYLLVLRPAACCSLPRNRSPPIRRTVPLMRQPCSRNVARHRPTTALAAPRTADHVDNTYNTVTLKLQTRIEEIRVPRNQPFHQSLVQGLDNLQRKVGLQVDISEVFVNGTRVPAPDWESRDFREQTVTVHVEPVGASEQQVQRALRQGAAGQGAGSREVDLDSLGQALCNLVAQFLLFAIGQQTFRKSVCTYFSKLAAAKDRRLLQVAKAMRLDLWQLAKMADAVVSQRNEMVHPVTLAVLEGQVAKMIKNIARFPELEDVYPNEVLFLRAYADLKVAFRDGFQTSPAGSHEPRWPPGVPCGKYYPVWSDQGWPAHARVGLQIWRAILSPGCVFLGDCVTTGKYWYPPYGTVLLCEDPPRARVGGLPPALAAPTGYKLVWQDDQKALKGGSKDYLSLWEPVAPTGYVSLGLVAGQGAHPPKNLPVRCVATDLVIMETLSRTAPDWTLPGYDQRTTLCGWQTDRRTGTFTVIGEGTWAAASGRTISSATSTFDAPRYCMPGDGDGGKSQGRGRWRGRGRGRERANNF